MGGELGAPGIKKAEISRGTSHTLLIVEVPGLHIPWTEPRDITIDELIERIESAKNGGPKNHAEDFSVVLCDATAEFVPYKVSIETLRAMADPANTKSVPALDENH